MATQHLETFYFNWMNRIYFSPLSIYNIQYQPIYTVSKLTSILFVLLYVKILTFTEKTEEETILNEILENLSQLLFFHSSQMVLSLMTQIFPHFISFLIVFFRVNLSIKIQCFLLLFFSTSTLIYSLLPLHFPKKKRPKERTEFKYLQETSFFFFIMVRCFSQVTLPFGCVFVVYFKKD